MTETRHLLIEIGCEELPPKSLLSLSEAFIQTMQQQLTNAKLNHGNIKAFATPRRLALFIEELSELQPDQSIERKGPPEKIAYDSEGNPSVACVKFAKSCGVTVEALQRKQTDKGCWLVYQQHLPGQQTQHLLPELISQALAALPIRKPMRWGSSDLQFVRPVHWVVVLYGEDVIDATILGQNSDRVSYGHRFHAPDAITLNHPNDYINMLESEGKVIVDFAQRRSLIEQQIHAIAAQHQATAVIDAALLNQVTAMVEWPVTLVGNFSSDFLQVPAEALICALSEHQNCFHMIDAEQQLLPHFITVSNIESRDPAAVIAGNERVMRARLADAQFFYQKDCKQNIDDWLEQLKNIVFQRRLGSLFDKTSRVTALASYLGEQLGVSDHATLTRAAQLSKVDLLADMVGEFPELQGIMGEYYAQNAGETDAIAVAIREHYLPRFASDNIAQSEVGKIIALADRIDSLVSLFAADQRPSGDKDPFALRRTAIALLRTLIGAEYRLDLSATLEYAASLLHETIPTANTQVDAAQNFVIDRLHQWYKEQGYQDDVLQAVLHCQRNDLFDIHQRLHALSEFLSLPSAQALAAANKRVSNLLNKDSSLSKDLTVDPALLQEQAEQSLAASIEAQQQKIAPLIEKHAYSDVLQLLAHLQQPIDYFFENVMIMADDKNIRNNRLALLKQLRTLFLQVADFSLLRS